MANVGLVKILPIGEKNNFYCDYFDAGKQKNKNKRRKGKRKSGDFWTKRYPLFPG
jgi:hypothetical protein